MVTIFPRVARGSMSDMTKQNWKRAVKTRIKGLRSTSSWSFLLAGFVTLSLLGYFAFTQWVEPVPYYTVQYDPEMQYFENSLALFKGIPYAYIDHPGTPVEVVGTILLALTRPITRGANEFFITYHLNHPELFLSMAHVLLLLLNLVTVTLLARKSFSTHGKAELGARFGVAVSYFAVLSPLTFESLHLWTHNAFNFPLGTLLLLGLYLRLRKGAPLSTLEILFIGMLSGILVAIQIYFAAWAAGVVVSIGTFVFLRTRRIGKALKALLVAIGGSVVGFSISFAPVMHRFREFYIWMKDLVFHQGRYGGGEAGFSTPGQMVDNLIWLWNREELIFIVSILAMLMLLLAMRWQWRERVTSASWWSLSIGVFVQTLLLWFVIVKHPGQNYLLSIAAVLPIQFVLSFDVFLRRATPTAMIARASGWLLLLGFFVGMVIALGSHNRHREQVELAEQQVAATLDDVQRQSGKSRSELVVLWGYGVPSKCYALRYGNFSTEGAALSKEIDEICPGEWTYDVWGGYAELPFAYEPLGQNQDWDLVILPERFLPADASSFSEVIYTSAQTQGYGRITILIRD
jgi:hypothetical protein